ncbi:UNVERIFIED_CONTAM: hypothetical protein GTU68_046149 [Idotea baltica]|nr:hypothetical protein [Idotea baltica]
MNEMNEFGQPIGHDLSDWQAPPFPEKAPIEGRYCRLEPLSVDRHVVDLFAAKALDEKGENWTYLPYGPFSDRMEYTNWIESVASAQDPQFYAVILKTSGEAVGVLSYLRIEPQVGSIEVGHIHFSKRVQKTPAATEAIFLLMERAFDRGYRRFEWKCDSLNAPSCRAAERFGFSFEGIFRQATIYKNRNRDTAWYSVIDSEWSALKEAFLRWLHPDNFDDSGNQRSSLRELAHSAGK